MASEFAFPDAPMIQRMRDRERRDRQVAIVGHREPVTAELRQRLDAIKENWPFPGERRG